MRHVAERAGVSLKTVSRVINEEGSVAPQTAERVTAAIAELGFRRNDLARSLRQGSTSATLGLVIEDLANPFYSAVAQAVENVARPRGYMLIPGSCEEAPERERELILALLRRRVDALLLVPAGTERDQAWLANELGDETPVVFVDRPPHGIDADAVLVDNAGGAQTAVAHLVAHGHRRIACVADVPKLYTAAERIAGYRAALDAAGLPQDAELLRLRPGGGRPPPAPRGRAGRRGRAAGRRAAAARRERGRRRAGRDGGAARAARPADGGVLRQQPRDRGRAAGAARARGRRARRLRRLRAGRPAGHDRG